MKSCQGIKTRNVEGKSDKKAERNDETFQTCPRCTYKNKSGAAACDICELPLNEWNPIRKQNPLDQVEVNDEPQKNESVGVIVNRMDAHQVDKEVQLHGIKALAIEACSSVAGWDNVIYEGGLRSIVAALQVHRGVTDVVNQGISALRNFSWRCAQTKRSHHIKAINSPDCLRIIVTALETHLSVETVQLSGCEMFQGMLTCGHESKDSASIKRIIKYGYVGVLVSAMREHIQCIPLQEAATFFIQHLAVQKVSNAMNQWLQQVF